MQGMKPRHFPSTGPGTLVAASLVLSFALAPAVRAQSAAVNPFTYLGRVMDSSHAAFDADRVATLSAYDAGGTLLAKSETFFRPPGPSSPIRKSQSRFAASRDRASPVPS